MHELNTRLNERFPLGEFTEQRPDLAFVTAPATQLHSLLQHLREREGFTHLVLLTAGDCVNGPDVVHAVADGHRTAASIDRYLKEKGNTA